MTGAKGQPDVFGKPVWSPGPRVVGPGQLGHSDVQAASMWPHFWPLRRTWGTGSGEEGVWALVVASQAGLG